MFSKSVSFPFLLFIVLSCQAQHDDENGKQAPVSGAVKPVIVTEKSKHDTDDPAVWINPADASKSLIIGTDKNSDGALYVYDLTGKIIPDKVITGLKRPNNTDVAYGLKLNNSATDIVAVTERETNKVRIYSLPDMKPLDNGGIKVFEGEKERAPMGIALYTRPVDKAIYMIVGRKSGPETDYLWQYRLTANATGTVQAELVRKFGNYSGKKEIESIAVDNELGFVYYSDEGVGIRKYYADPDKPKSELALFGVGDFKEDIEGISIYKTNATTGYILVSNQQADTFIVYKRQGEKADPHRHQMIAEIPVSTRNSDGSEVTHINLGPAFPGGLFVAMSEGKVFHFYDWRDMEARIHAAADKGL